MLVCNACSLSPLAWEPVPEIKSEYELEGLSKGNVRAEKEAHLNFIDPGADEWKFF